MRAQRPGGVWARGRVGVWAVKVVAGLLPLLPCTIASAQVEVGGRGLRLSGQDTVPLGGAMIVLHRISAAVQGPLDSVRAGPDGRFRFRIPPDSQSLILASSRYSGIEYFSRPARLTGMRGDSSLLVVAADTSSAAPIGLAARYLVVSRPIEGGRRGVLDLIVMQNRSAVTRVAPDTSRPAWSLRLPPGLTNFAVGDGEVSQAAVGLSGDTMTIASPLPPGERQLVVTYALPSASRSVAVPLDVPADSVVIMLEEDGASVAAPGFTKAEPQVIEGTSYQRWVATGTGAGVVTLRFPAVGAAGRRVPAALAAMLAAILAGAAAWLVRRRRSETVRAAGDREALIEAVAALDARYLGREHEVAREEWAGYVAERAVLRERIDAATRLAGGGPVR